MKKKTLIVVLTGCMVLSPVSVYAADATETPTEAKVTETAAQEDSADSESTGELEMTSTVSAWSLTVRQ